MCLQELVFLVPKGRWCTRVLGFTFLCPLTWTRHWTWRGFCVHVFLGLPWTLKGMFCRFFAVLTFRIPGGEAGFPEGNCATFWVLELPAEPRSDAAAHSHFSRVVFRLAEALSSFGKLWRWTLTSTQARTPSHTQCTKHAGHFFFFYFGFLKSPFIPFGRGFFFPYKYLQQFWIPQNHT